MKNNFGQNGWQEDTKTSDTKNKQHVDISSKKNSSSKRIKPDEGEYVDYTEIK